MYAAEKGRTDTVKLLLDQGLNISATDDNGMTALLYASSAENSATLQLLLDRGAPPLACDRSGASALHFAAMVGDPEKLKILLPLCRSLLEKRDEDGTTPLGYAAMNGGDQAVRLLLDNSANLNALVNGRPLIDVAEEGGHTATVQMLRQEPGRRKAIINTAIHDGIGQPMTVRHTFRVKPPQFP
jgi:ankyrin repeat protein